MEGPAARAGEAGKSAAAAKAARRRKARSMAGILAGQARLLHKEIRPAQGPGGRVIRVLRIIGGLQALSKTVSEPPIPPVQGRWTPSAPSPSSTSISQRRCTSR